jgi:hypothetical protein
MKRTLSSPENWRSSLATRSSFSGQGVLSWAPRDIPHQLRNSGNVENHYLLVFSPSGFEEFLKATAVPAPDNAVAPTEPPAVSVQNVHKLAAAYGIHFG